jgi:hypothetical protein
MSDEPIFDLSNKGVVSMLVKVLKASEGFHRVSITKCRDQRTLNQNAYYWGVVIPHISAGLLEAWGEKLDADETHDWLKREFLSKPIVDRKTGDVKGYAAGSSAKLDTAQFGDYLDAVKKFAGEKLEIEIPEPISLEAA